MRELGKDRTRPQVTRAPQKLGPSALAALAAAARRTDPAVRAYALEALEGVGPLAAEPLPDLRRWAGDPDGGVRARAVRSVGVLGEAAADVPLLIAGLSDPDDGVCLAAVEAIGRVGPPAADAITHLEAAGLRADAVDERNDAQGVSRPSAGA